MNIASPEGMAQAVAWQTKLLAAINDGGVWVIPRSMTIVKVYHAAKTAVFVGGTIREPDIVKVFKAMGWMCECGGGDSYNDQRSFSA